MMATLSEDYEGVLRCPRTGERLQLAKDRFVPDGGTTNAKHFYPIVSGLPILVDFDHSVLDEDVTLSQAAISQVERPRHSGMAALVKRILSPTKSTTRRNIHRLLSEVERRGGVSRVLVVGGGSIGQGMGPLYEHPMVKVYSFDIYSTDKVQFIADAHSIPVIDSYFDVVVIQAVLEHVLRPDVVVEEIWRVLKPGGLVYAETPFMQQVHEGAYDFTRFTQSGHRYLFRRFGLIDSGPSGGPGLQFMWSIDYLFRSLFRSRRVGKIAKTLVFWAQYLDMLIPAAYASDGASGTFFFGSKSEREMTPRDIIRYYAGAQQRGG